RYVSTGTARQMLAEIVPVTDISRLERDHALNAEAMGYLAERRVPFHDVPLLGEVLEKLQTVGSTLDIPEIEAVQQFLVEVEGLRGRWRGDRESYPLLAQKSAALPDLRDLFAHLGRAIQNGQIDDRYSPELARIRRGLATARA